jgi:hypothetical protein
VIFVLLHQPFRVGVWNGVMIVALGFDRAYFSPHFYERLDNHLHLIHIRQFILHLRHCHHESIFKNFNPVKNM